MEEEEEVILEEKEVQEEVLFLPTACLLCLSCVASRTVWCQPHWRAGARQGLNNVSRPTSPPHTTKSRERYYKISFYIYRYHPPPSLTLPCLGHSSITLLLLSSPHGETEYIIFSPFILCNVVVCSCVSRHHLWFLSPPGLLTPTHCGGYHFCFSCCCCFVLPPMACRESSATHTQIKTPEI